ncbi:amidohydrolase family protein [Coraliomargarita sinensis]|uniref:amidohydrolase family protein n=1 Tax=Coraliomargarita sinensis TaxID=2174842 RepID=UPI0013050634|nr:amidohydrolase family protein [Coraliomargarita sinensis]
MRNPITILRSIVFFYAGLLPMVHADPAADGIIDTHWHAMACQDDALDQVTSWMEEKGVIHAIVHPLGKSRPKNDVERRKMLAHFKAHDGRIERFCIIKPNEVGSIEEAVKILETEKRDGAIGFGEHYGEGLMFDAPANMRLFAACQKVGLPIMFHMDDKQNKDTADFKHLAHALDSYPKTIFIAHGPNWWKRFGSSNCDRMLSEHTNLYADISAGSGATALSKDRTYTAEFMQRHRKKLLFGTDCGWWSFRKNAKPAPQFELMRTLDIPDDVKIDIYRGNAQRLFGF